MSDSKPRRNDSIRTLLKQAISEEPPARAKILSAAIVVFRKKGLQACSVEDLLTEGSVSRGSFYQYFQSKYDVAAALFRHLQTILVNVTRRASTGEREPQRRLDNTFDVYMKAQIDIGWLHAMLLAESKQPGSPLAVAREELQETMAGLIDRALRDIQGRAIDADVFRALIYALEELTLRTHQQGKFTEAHARHIRDVMLPIIQRVLAAPDAALLPLPPATDNAR